MNLKDLQKNWDEFGKLDPFWAILTEESKKGNKWEEADFFQKGEKWVERELQQLKRNRLKAFERKTALDFGCGVGRLTRALAGKFEQVKGIDIAPSMIDKARQLNAHLPNCEFILNERNDLHLFSDDSFDLVLSLITLQHMHPKFARAYLAEFIRVLKPGGLIIFQLPSTNKTAPAYSLIRKSIHLIKSAILAPKEPVMEMYGIHISEMCAFLENQNGIIYQIKQNNYSGDSWSSFTYYITK
ncbi:MAG: class I SAM-dependent methyltransferase [Saprospiraceae bacterium]|nr:class I SAM-dependent methyltransferase [Saprospiraceae bacterium]